jgi:hypothetical protein
MNDKIINEFENYLTKFNVKSVSLNSYEGGLQITCSLYTFKIMIDLGMIAAIIIGFYLNPDKKTFDLLIVSLFFILFIIMFWLDLNSINIIRIDLADRTIQIISRNIIKKLVSKYVLKRETIFAFSEISSFSTRSNGTLDTGLKKYFVDLKPKEKSKQAIAYSRNEAEAITIASFMTNIIRN